MAKINKELYDALKTVANLNINLEDLANQLPDISDGDLEKTMNKFNETVIGYDSDDMIESIDDCIGYIRMVTDLIDKRW